MNWKLELTVCLLLLLLKALNLNLNPQFFQVDENGKIVEAKFKTFGCGSAIASSSLATEMISGKSVDYAKTVKNDIIAKELCLPPVKLHCSSE